MLFELTMLMAFAIQHLLIGGVLIIVLMSLSHVFKLSSTVQSWLWVTAFLLSTVVPFLSFNSDSRELSPKVVTGPFAVNSESLLEQEPEPLAVEASDGEMVWNEWNVSSEVVFWLSPIIYFLLLVWLFGSIWRFVSVGCRFFRTKKVVAESSSLTGEFKDAFGSLRWVEVRVCSAASNPMAVGLIRPVILVPDSFFRRFDSKSLLPIVLHEYAHVRRGDLWVGMVQEILAIIFWWSPAMRILNRKIHLSREVACDLWAARKLSDRKRYAQSLVDSARLMVDHRCNVLAMGLFSKKKELTHRLNEVLEMKTDKRGGLFGTIAACMSVFVGTLLVADELTPKVNLEAVKREANHFSELSRAKGELLMDAIRRGDYGLLGLMIENGLDVNTPIRGDGTALIVAVKHGDMKMVETLHQLGADVNQSARGDGNPLIAAAKFDRLEIAKFLLREGAKVDEIVVGDETALINASRSGSLAMVRFLVESGADVNLGVDAQTWGSGVQTKVYRSPLNMASSSSIRDYLIGKGAIR